MAGLFELAGKTVFKDYVKRLNGFLYVHILERITVLVSCVVCNYGKGFLLKSILGGVLPLLWMYGEELYSEGTFQWPKSVRPAAFFFLIIFVIVQDYRIEELKSRIAILEQNTGSGPKKEENATEQEAGNGSLLASQNETNGSGIRNVRENTGTSPGQENETEDTGMNQMVEEEPGNTLQRISTPSKKYVKFDSRFNGYYLDLLGDLSASSLCHHLFSLHVITINEMETITREKTSLNQNTELLSILCKREIPEDDFKKALIDTAQDHLIPKFFGNIE